MNKGEIRTFIARSYSSGTPGRAICNSRNHHFIADEFGGDELTAGEYFLTGLTACAVNLIVRVARETDVTLRALDVRAEGSYEKNSGTTSRTLFHVIKMNFQFTGVSQEEAEVLVATYCQRCPLYGTVAAAIPNITTAIEVA